jgi:hypothetical protein
MQKTVTKKKLFYLKFRNSVVVGNDLLSFHLAFKKRLIKGVLGLKIKKPK